MISLSVPRSSRSLSPKIARSAPASPMSAKSPEGSMSARERSGSVCTASRNVIPLCLQLTPPQVTAIRKSWRHINTKGLITVLTRCFTRLESTCPVASQCFQTANFSLSTNPNSCRNVADHAKYLLQLLDRIVDGDVDTETCREIGANHVALKQDFGFSTSEWDRFQEIMVEVILKQDGVQQSKETSRAWRLLICAFVEHIRDGFDAQVRQFRRKHSFNAHLQYFDNIERRVSTCQSRKISLNQDPRLIQNGRKLSNN